LFPAVRRCHSLPLGWAKSDPGDNAMCESLFASVDCGLPDRHRFGSRSEGSLTAHVMRT
jgi:hypothetical protein